MKKKYIIFIVSALMLLGVVIFLIVKQNIKSTEPKSSVIVAFPKNIKGLETFSNNILIEFSSTTNYPHKLIIDNSKSYTDMLNIGLTNNSSDIFYVVNSRIIRDPLISVPALDFKLNNRAFKKLTSSLKTFTSSSQYFTYIPVTWAPWGIYYNKRVFSELGLKEPKTFKDLEIICNTAKNNNYVPFSMLQGAKWPFTSWFDYIDIRINGGAFHNQLLSGLIDFESDEVKKSFNFLYTLINNGWFKNDPSSNMENMINTIIDNETIMSLSSTFFFDAIPEKEKNNIGWFPFPKIDKSEYNEIVSSSGFITSESITNIDGVNAFYKYILGDDSQSIIENNTPFNSINKKVIRNSKREDLIDGFKNIKKSKILLPSFERNVHSVLNTPLKNSLNALFFINSVDEVNNLLFNLEIIRKDIY